MTYIARARFAACLTILCVLFSFAGMRAWGAVPHVPTTAPASQPVDTVEEPAPTTVPADEPAPASQPAIETPTVTPTVPASQPVAEARPAISGPTPRLELHIHSLQRLATQSRDSNSGVWLRQAVRLLEVMGTASAEGVELNDELSAALQQVRTWPDTSVHLAHFGMDNEGRTRWAVRLDWPLDDLHGRIAPLFSSESGSALLEGVALKPRLSGGYDITLPESVLAHLLPASGGGSCLASHCDLAADWNTSFAGDAATGALVRTRLNLKAGAPDSGATFFSSFRAVTDVVYAGRVDESGDWIETVNVHWPPISGLGAKVFLSKVKQSFFVPEEAFGAGVLSSSQLPAILVSAMGLGPQFVMDESGEMSMIGDMGDVGPIASALGPETCLTLLPGTGVLPMPDIVVQTRAKRKEKLIESIRDLTREINAAHRQRDQKPPWQEITVRDRTVFWSEGASISGMVMMPVIMRPVLFLAQERDGEQKSRDFLVVGWTSTSPEALVRRWLDFPRGEKLRRLPSESKTDGQMWIHWKQVYRWAAPYLNLGLSVAAREALLPRGADIAKNLTDGWASIRAGYTGLELSHRGPVPVGVLVLPILAELSGSMDSSESDLARERAAAERLKVLYHHCKLFRKDIGRWPAELGELDGYVDFAGHPELLHLSVSPKKRWSEWFEGLFEAGDDEDEEASDEGVPEIESKRFVIEWKRGSWKLGCAPGALDHLEKLYIDEEGKIHRVVKQTAAAPDDRPAQP